MNETDQSSILSDKVSSAFRVNQPLFIKGSGTKFLQGRSVEGNSVNVVEHRGITEYTPTELVITARAGTLLNEIESQLLDAGQMLPFEPPHLGENATLGGTIACGLSGPRRPYTGAARDMVLGMRMINGRGEILHFGGQVMKNVAGYDVSRLMVGAQGTLGIILDVSLKVLPMPEYEVTLSHETNAYDAIRTMNQLAKRPLPLSAACFIPRIDNEVGQESGQLWLRLSGVDTAVNTAVNEIGGETHDQYQQFWLDLRERNLPFFKQTGIQKEHALWRLSLPPASPPLDLSGPCLVDWGGAQRWLISRESPERIHKVVNSSGGHAALYSTSGVLLPPLASEIAKLHQRVKNAFDPKGILNPGRLYEDL